MQWIANYGRALTAVMLVVISVGTAAADWNEFWHNVHVGYHRNNAWPNPFNEVDAMHVVAPFEMMKRNGWRVNNTLGNNLFRDGDAALMASGHNRVRWIATQAPLDRRNIFVLRGRSQAETDARLASVRQTLANYQLRGPVPQVFVTDRPQPTWSGALATHINRTWLEQTPDPKLPSTSAQGTASATQ